MNTSDLSPEESEAAVRAKAEADRIAEEIAISDLKFVMAHKQSRRFIWRLLAKARIFNTTHSAVHADSAFMEGARNFGLGMLLDITTHTPERYIELLTEIKDDNRKHTGSSS